MDQESIAGICHEINRAYCESQGDDSQPSWEDAPEWQKASARMGVALHMSGDYGPEASHVNWMFQKLDEGWVYGEVKDPVAKRHPCIKPFDELPKSQQAKDFIFRAVVHALREKDARKEERRKRTALRPAILEAMTELGDVPPGESYSVDRAYNLLHKAFWGPGEIPDDAKPLR